MIKNDYDEIRTIHVLSELVEALAGLAQRLVEGRDDHELLSHAGPLRAHARVDEVDRARLGDGDLWSYR